MTAGIYSRVSTVDQEPQNQLAELRQYVAARGWKSREFTDRHLGSERIAARVERAPSSCATSADRCRRLLAPRSLGQEFKTSRRAA
jgi:hypothetical protein